LANDYRKLILIYAMNSNSLESTPYFDSLSNMVTLVQPVLDPEWESQAFLAECRARSFLNQKYEITQ